MGQGITIRGQNGTIGYNACIGGPGNVSVINLGTISCDVSGGTIYLNAQPFNNQGVMGATNGGTLVVAGSCVNSGSFGGSGGTVTISGSFDNQAGTLTNAEPTTISGTFSNGAGQTLIFEASGTITGFLDNEGGQVVVNGANPLTLNSGTIQGGTVIVTNGASLVVQGSGTLDGVTVNGLLDVGNTYNGANLTVTNGLTLNGTALVGLVGNPTNNQWYGRVFFGGSQTLAGDGTVSFGNATFVYCGAALANALDLPTAGLNADHGAGHNDSWPEWNHWL